MQVTFETRARSAAHFCPFVKPFSEKFVGDFVKNESLSPVFSRDRDSERLWYSQEEFDQRDFSDFYGPSEPVAYAVGSDDPTVKSFFDRFAPYKAFGIEYVEAQSVSGRGNVYYNGQLVDTFIDITPADGVFSFQSADGGGIKVQTVYDPDGALTGVQALRR